MLVLGQIVMVLHTFGACRKRQQCKQERQLQPTVVKPSGDSTVYKVTLNNGAWPTSIQHYSGGVNASNLLMTVNTTWDFSNACPWPNCHGAAYVRRLSETTTMQAGASTAT